MSAREAILLKYSGRLNRAEEALQDGNALEELGQPLHYHVSSPCFRSLGNLTTSWTSFNNHRFTIAYDGEGEDNDEESAFAACYQAAQRFVDASSVDRPAELAHRQVYAMSYFYDRMKDIKVIKEESGWIKVRDYFRYGEHLCGGTIRMKRQSAFLCLDLAYIAAYLHDGLGLPLHKDLLVSVGGVEIEMFLIFAFFV